MPTINSPRYDQILSGKDGPRSLDSLTNVNTYNARMRSITETFSATAADGTDIIIAKVPKNIVPIAAIIKTEASTTGMSVRLLDMEEDNVQASEEVTATEAGILVAFTPEPPEVDVYVAVRRAGAALTALDMSITFIYQVD